MLEAIQLARLRGDRLLFRQLSFQVKPGEVLRITGPNGVGKTSLLRILTGLVPPDAGEVRWQGGSIQAEREAYQRDLLYVGHSFALNDLLTPLENLHFLCASAGQSAHRRDCIAALQRIGLGRQQDLPARILSQGQRRRVALARLFLSPERALWVLDEPFSALDVMAVDDLAQTLHLHCTQGGMVILITHQEVVFAQPPRILQLTEAHKSAVLENAAAAQERAPC